MSFAQKDNSYNVSRSKWFYNPGDSLNLNWQEVASPTIDRALSAPQIIFLKTKLPNLKIERPALFIDAIYQIAAVFYQDSLIYSFGDLTNDNPGVNRTWHVINLPQNFQNKEIAFKIRSNQAKIGLSDYILIDSAESIYQKMFKNDLLKLLSALFLVLFSLIAFYLVIYLRQFVYLGLCGFILFTQVSQEPFIAKYKINM